MALSHLFANGAQANKLCKFEIRPDADFVILKGSPLTTPDFNITGNVVLMTSETIQTKGIRLVLQGKRKTMHFSSERERKGNPHSPAHIVNKATFFTEEIRLAQHGHGIGTIPKGNHSFPFEFRLPGSISESVEGIAGSFIVYDMKAVADRGIMAKDMVCKKHIRLIRTLPEDPIDLMDPQTVDGTWPDKIRYTLSTPSLAAIYGDKVVSSIELTPLVEKLRIGRIRISLIEMRKTKTVPGPILTQEGSSGMWPTEAEVGHKILEVPEGSEETNQELQMPMLKFNVAFSLPRSLTKCRQTVEKNEWIKIKHQMRFEILLMNPDGHNSQLKAHHPIKLYISPNLPIGENNEVSPSPVGKETSETLFREMNAAPPTYQRHSLDPLYEDIDTSGYQTPYSSATTPSFGQSRQHSFENLSSLAHQAPAQMPQELLDRLNRVAISHDMDFRTHGVDPSSSSVSQTPSAEALRSSSVIDPGLASPTRQGHSNGATRVGIQQAFNMEELERLPSFDTAQRVPPPNMSQTELPPSYGTAMSHPSSPARH